MAGLPPQDYPSSISPMTPDDSHRELPRTMQPELVRIIGRTAIGSGIALSLEERARHAYLVGKSGSGKSTTLFNLAMHDITAGEGVAVIDPHGELAEQILDAMPPARTHDVCYLNVADGEFPVGFNPLAGRSGAATRACSIGNCLGVPAPLERFVGTAPGAFPLQRGGRPAHEPAAEPHRVAAPVLR